MAALLQGQPIAALGLGELHTHSALNQPFYAEIELFEVDQNALDAVKASLASQSAFEQAGIERPHALTRLQFTPMMGARGEPMIQVITREPIREPYLDLLVEVIWPDGRLVKEYAVLLDPPAVGGQRTPRVAPPRPARATQSPLAAAAQASSASRLEPDSGASSDAQRPESVDTASAEQPAASQPLEEIAEQIDVESVVVDVEIPASAAELDFPLRYGPIRPGDGLIRIARRLTPPGATLEQTAMAIYRNSQDAFHNGDINQLRIGAELVIPTAAELFALPPQAALAQYRSALAGRPVVATPLTDLDVRLSIVTSEVSQIPAADSEASEAAEEVQADLDPPGLAPASASELSERPIADTEAEESEAEEVQGDLALPDLATASDPGATEALAPALSPSQTDAMLEAEMLLLREVSEANRQEATELRTRVKELEAQLDDIRRLLELRNAQLSSLAMAEGQTASSVTNELAETEDHTGEATQPANAGQNPAAIDDQSPAAISAAGTSSDAASAGEPEAVSGTDPMTVISAWRQALPRWELLLLGVGLLLALLGLMRYRRSRQASSVAAVDVDDALRERDMDNEPFSDDLQLDPEWPIAQTVGATQVNGVGPHVESAPTMPVDQRESSWQGEAIELDALTGEQALAAAVVTQHDMTASESAAEPAQDAERWARIENALAGEVPEAGSLVEETPEVDAEAPEVGAVVDDDDDGEELFLDLDELEQVVESSPVQPSESPFALDQPDVGDRSVAEDQSLYELNLAALDALTNAEPSHAVLPEPELSPFVSEPSQPVEHQSFEHLDDLELPTLADLPDADAAAVVASPAVDQDVDQDAGDLGSVAVATEEGGNERWPIETDEGWDEVGLKLDLARAYLDMDDPDAASAILREVVAEGRDEQRREAESLLAGLS
ncbi:FimV/HubP family polar landmark protein [Lamprobacter modestohalophilus]|uniref:FimV/HubP family polar landmark protein n=1 Tax=Lamprobacter modestohalophilus TaxID=1064514 RepID=UPI002ADEE44D|nr:FimV/HubP family polar landmark protein [Lamprobacter modestohalophilus]MEA1051148.1 FimV/HubP family polar landmark protein [Lamprobacter modestohalophilus]